MPKYLIHATHTKEGLDGLLKEGGSSRRAAVDKAVQGLGGKMEAFYYAFGETDIHVIVDLPGNVAAAALSLIANASGASTSTFTVLITPEEMDQSVSMAKEKSASYRLAGR